MGAPIAGGLLVQGRFPLDDKYWANTVGELDNGLTYVGQIRFTKDTEQPYIKRTPGWSLLVPPSTGGGGGSIGISELRNYPITKDGEQLIRLPSPASKIILVLNIEQGRDVSVVVDYSINVRGDLLITEDAKVQNGDFITCIYTTGTSSGGSTDPGETGETSAKFMEIQEQIDDTYYRLNVLNTKVEQLAQGGSVVPSSDRWIPTSTWLDGTVITEDNYTRYCDNILFRRVATNKYEKVRLDDNRVNMSWYLIGDDINKNGTDNFSRLQDFLAYLRQAISNFTMTLVFTDYYYISNTIYLQILRLKFRGSGTIRFAPNINGFYPIKHDNDFYDFGGKLKIISTGGTLLGDRSLRDPRSTVFTDFTTKYGIPDTLVKFQTNLTLRNIIDSTPIGGKIPSFDPLDYSSAIVSTAVINVNGLYISGFGNGILLNAPDINNKTSVDRDGMLLSADGVDTSMSLIQNVKVEFNRGYGIAIVGNDSNQVRIVNCDARDNGLWGLYDGSQAGCHWLFNHTAVNTWGGYAIVARADSTVIGGYQEIDRWTTNIFNSGTVLGGPLNSNYIGAAFVLRGNKMNSAQIGFLKTDRLLAGGTTDGTGSMLTTYNIPANGSNINEKSSITKQGRENQVLVEKLDNGEASADGRVYQTPMLIIAPDIKTPFKEAVAGFSLHSISEYPISSLVVPIGIRFYKGDRLKVRVPNRVNNQPYLLECISGGTSNNASHTTFEDVVVSITSAQSMTYNRPTSLFQDGDILNINGQDVSIGNSLYVANDTSKASTGANILQPLTNTTSPATIKFGQCVFRVINGDTPTYGATSQRPSLKAVDKYFKYQDETLGQEIRWDGTKWIDAMGSIV